MRFQTDDQLGTVNNIFLGPDGVTFWWRARHIAYGIGLALAALSTLLMLAVGVPVNAYTGAWGLAGVVFLTRAVGARISYETPFRALAVTLWHEMTAPRPGRPVLSARLRPGRVRVSDSHGRAVCRGCESHPAVEVTA